MGLRLVADVLVVHVGGADVATVVFLPITLHCASHLPHFHLLWKRLLLSAHDATHSHYGDSAIDLQFCCPFDKGKKRKLPLALFHLCSSHCAIFMSSLKVSRSPLQSILYLSQWLVVRFLSLADSERRQGRLGSRPWKSPRSGCSGSRGVFSEQLAY